MGFLSNRQVNSIMQEEYKLKLKAWALKYPFAAMIMSDATYEDKLAYTEERFL